MKKIIEEEILRQLQLINFDKGKTISEQYMAGGGREIAAATYETSKYIQDENKKEDESYQYLYDKWAPYVCGTGGGGISPDNSFGAVAGYCDWVKNGLTPFDICNSPIVDVKYNHPTKDFYPLNYAQEVNKRRKEGKKYVQTGGGIVVKKEKGYLYNTYWCECKKDVEFYAPTEYNSNLPTGSFFKLDGPLNLKYVTNVPTVTSVNDWFDLKKCTATNKAEEVVDKYFHTVAPFISLVLNFFGPIGMALGAVIEFADGVKYQEEGNTYAAGLSYTFAALGPLDFGLSPFIKSSGNSLIKKTLIKSSKYSVNEIKLLQFLKNTNQTMRLVRLGTAFKFVRVAMTYIMKSKIFGLFLLKLINLGVATTAILSKLGLIIGGGFIGWDYIA